MICTRVNQEKYIQGIGGENEDSKRYEVEIMSKKNKVDYNIAQKYFGYRGKQGPLLKVPSKASKGSIFRFYK